MGLRLKKLSHVMNKKDWVELKRDVVFLSALAVPLLLSIVSFIVIKMQEMRQAKLAAAGELLGPPLNYSPIAIALIAFIGAYLLFLVLMFYDNIHDVILKLQQKKPHRKGLNPFLLSVPIFVSIGAMIYAKSNPVVPSSAEMLSPIGVSSVIVAIFLAGCLYFLALAFVFLRNTYQ